MTRIPTLAAIGTALLLTGCAAFNPPTPGTSEADVLARLGQPTQIYTKGATTLFEYGAGSFGQYSYMARLTDGKLVSYEQTWTLANFQSIKIGQFNKEDVLHLVGRPTEVTGFARSPYEVWNYGFKESGVWNSMMSVYFDDDGIVRKIENGPDLRYDPIVSDW
jgi:hypothetical protein